MRRALAGAACVVLLVAGCSTTSGSGSANGSSASSSGAGTSSSPDFPSGSSGSSGTGTAASSSAPSRPALSARDAALTAQTNGQAHDIVAIPSGYQAAVYDQAGDIYFWYDPVATTTWRQIGQSEYPTDTRDGPPQAKVTGALLHGMSDATFIVHGLFTGDGSGNAVAFTTGSKGWGAIKAEKNGNIGPSGAAVDPSNQIGLSYGFGFRSGDLVTEDCPTNRPISDCGSHAVRKTWRWTGHDFAVT